MAVDYVLDTNIFENITFTDSFSKGFHYEKSLEIIKEFSSTWNDTIKKPPSISKSHEDSNKSLSNSKPTDVQCDLRSWGLPPEVVSKYESKGIKHMFHWQVECLKNPRIIEDCGNLIYSAPTSAGKTLVAEILTIKTVLERRKKVIVILPFVSVVREKMFYFQDIFSDSGIRVEGFMGSYTPPGGIESVQVAICTIEKANSLINRMMEEGNISDLGAVVVDELHLLGDPHRGYILELLLTKLIYVTKKLNVNIQIIGMSATLPNLDVLAQWLQADLYKTDFRPIPLKEFCITSGVIFDPDLKMVREIKPCDELLNDKEFIIHLCLETITENCSVLIFCPTKNWCENLAQQISTTFRNLGYSNSTFGTELRKQLNSENINEVLEQLKSSPVGLDSVLGNTISFGVAFHHAGLTMDERDIIEGGFKSCAIRVLIATSTLSSGVNLPARRVIIRSPMFNSKPINIATYKQMVGRAGRMGIDSSGESILVCSANEKHIASNLISGTFDPISSCLEGDDKLMRAVLEAIASEVATTKEDVILFVKSTLLLNTASDDILLELADKTVKQLKEYELIRFQNDEFIATPLGKACLSSSMSPQDGLSLFIELQKARECFVLETDLHMIYLVTPYSICNQWGELNWLHYLNLWEHLSPAMKRVGKLVGINESILYRSVRNANKNSVTLMKNWIYRRFYTALALQDLVNEVPLNEVADKFSCSRGMLQSLQQSASTFAGMVTAFSRQLGWKSFEMLVSHFQDRLYFGIQSDLLDLMKLQSMNGLRARAIFNAGIETIFQLANAKSIIVENALNSAVPFQSEKIRDGEHKSDADQRINMKCVWITGKKGLTTKTAAELLIVEAKIYLQMELGVSDVKWNSSLTSVDTNDGNNVPMLSEGVNISATLQHSTPNNMNSTRLSKTNSIMESTDSGNITHESNIISDCSFDNNEPLIEVISPKDKIESIDTRWFTKSFSNTNKSNSIFSSEHSKNISMFEDSLVVDTQLCGILDHEKQVSPRVMNNEMSLANIFEKSFNDTKITKRKLSQDDDTISSQAAFKKPKLIKNLLDYEFKLQTYEFTTLEFLESIKNLNIYNCNNHNMYGDVYLWISNLKILSLHLEIGENIEFTNINNIGKNILKKKLQSNLNDSKKLYKYYIKGIAICSEDRSVYVNFNSIYENEIINLLKNIFQDNNKKIMLFGCKSLYIKLFKCYGILIDCSWEDPLIADWLLDSEGLVRSLMKMVDAYCSYSIDDIIKRYEADDDRNIHVIASIKAYSVWNVLNSLKNIFREKHPNMINTFDFEMRALKVLAHCELSGIKVDKVKAGTIFNLIKSSQQIFEINAFKITGRRFRFTSSSEVAKVIGIYKGRKIKTNKSVLEKVDNPLAEIIIYWRKLNAIITKNLFPLILKAANDSYDERIYASYWTHTSTGRITMQEPNLQCIPRNFEIPQELLGKGRDYSSYHNNSFSCRNIFTAENDCVYISADYCQLELRLLSHLSKDKTLLNIVRSDEDIFKLIASTWKCIPKNEVDDDLRQKTKQMCYGIIYGMGVKTLAASLDMNEIDAELFLKTFHEAYPGIRTFTNSIIGECKNLGYVETLNGRRRYLPSINSRNIPERAHAERQAVNTMIQGSAADILKSAMISINDCIKKEYPLDKIKLILLLHDELIYEIPVVDVDRFIPILRKCMEETVSLSVPLPVKIKCGKAWGDMNVHS